MQFVTNLDSKFLLLTPQAYSLQLVIRVISAKSRRLLLFLRDLIRSLPVRSTFGLPIFVAASPAASFSTTLRSARNNSYALDVFVLEMAFAL